MSPTLNGRLASPRCNLPRLANAYLAQGHWSVSMKSFPKFRLLILSFFLRNLSQNIQEMHRDHVPAVPPGFELLGSTDGCYNEGMVRYISGAPGRLAELSDIRILTVQGHPEFTKSIVSKVVGIRTDKGIFTPEFAQDAIRRNELRNDGVEVIARAIWKMLGVTHAEN